MARRISPSERAASPFACMPVLICAALTACGSSTPIAAPTSSASVMTPDSVPLAVDSTHGSGNFGQWRVDEFGLPFFEYQIDQATDPRAVQPELLPDRNRNAQHQLGNDHVTAFTWNDGYTVLWSQDRLFQWANAWEPNEFKWSGGFGYLNAGGKIISTLYPDRPADAEMERDWALGYMRRTTRADGFEIREEIYAPFGNDPLLLHDVTIRNDGAEPRDASWFEYWDVNPYNRSAAHNRGVAAPMWDEASRTLSAKQLADIDTDPLTIFASALSGPLDGFETSLPAFFGLPPNRAAPAAVVADALGNSISLPSPLGARSLTLFAFRAPLTLAPGESITLRYAYGMAHDAAIPALVDKYRAAPDPFRESETAWAQWVPHADFGEANRWVARELAWDSYLLRSASVFEEECGHHNITQGGYYQYSLGYNLGYRSWLHYVFPMVYSDPELARENIRYAIVLQPEIGFVPYGSGPLCTRFDLGTSNDLDFWLLLAAADYGLGMRDLAFFDELLPYHDTGRDAPVWEHLKASYAHQESLRGPNGGYIMGATGDWSDFSTQMGPMTESMLVAAQLAYAYPLLADLAELRGDLDWATELRARGAELHDTVAGEWTGLGWYSRGYFGVQQIGAGVPYGEPQPWAILAGIPDAERATQLVANIRRFLTGIGAPGGPSQIGSGMSPARDDPDITEHAPGIVPSSPPFPDALGLFLARLPNAPLAGAAVYPGGTWFDVNGWLTWSLASLDGVVENAREYAWDEYTRNTLAAHATAFPDHWAGTISTDDACNTWYGSDPSRCGIGVPTWSGNIAEQPTWMMMDSLRLAGLNVTRDGYRIAPHFPFDDFSLAWPRIGIERRGNTMRGYFIVEADGPLKVTVHLPTGDEKELTLQAKAGKPANWSVQW